MKSKILDRPMFKKPTDETDVENVGIMQGFMDEDDDLDYAEYMKEEEPDEDSDMAGIMDRRPDSPEILMNNLRGDMRSIDARVEELADLVGFNAAADTPQDVLALLQPVFAAQQAPAMPQAMPPQAMPQGGIPQEGMPPEMMGGMPQEMPQEMPPEMMGGMPQAMPQAMPPEMMGGIGALAADQGPGMAEPVMMAKGGPVQYFSDGTDEDGVTPDDNTSSFAGLLPPEVITAAQERYLSSLTQKPLVTPDLASEVKRRTPMYEELMGVDNNLSQAQILFELGQRAFNFGANVDDQGKPLRGSAAARLAGAVRTLPGSIGQITGQMDQQRRAVRGAALQASEKNIENLIQNQARMGATLSAADAKIIAADITQRGLKERAAAKALADENKPLNRKAYWDVDTQLIPGQAEKFAKGQLTPDEDNQFIAAAMSTFKPRVEEYTDEKGRKVTKTIPGLEFLSTVDALKARGVYDIIKTALREGGIGMGSAGITPSRPSAGIAGTSGIPQEVEDKVRKLAAQFEANKKKRDKGEMSNEDFYNSSSEIQMQIDQATAAVSEQPRGFIEPAKDTLAVKDAPKDTLAAKDAPKKKSDKKASSPFENMSLINIAPFVTGPGASLKRGFSNIPGLGSSFPDTTQATAFYETAINRIVTALKTTDRFGNMERTEIKKELGLDPALYQDEALLRNKLLGLGDFIKQQRDESKRLSERTDINVDISKSAEATLQEMNRALEIIYGKGQEGMPDGVVANKPIKVYSAKELEGLPSGTRFLWNGVEPRTLR